MSVRFAGHVLAKSNRNPRMGYAVLFEPRRRRRITKENLANESKWDNFQMPDAIAEVKIAG